MHAMYSDPVNVRMTGRLREAIDEGSIVVCHKPVLKI